jgi:fluoride exporter
MSSAFFIFMGAGIGGVLRYFLDLAVTRLAGSQFPFGILTVNVLGCLAMGLLAGWLAFKGQTSHEVRLFLATGILGGFTTFSAFALDTALLVERGRPGLALVYVLASVVLSILALFAGLYLIRGHAT